jgi:hypothetical protein
LYDKTLESAVRVSWIMMYVHERMLTASWVFITFLSVNQLGLRGRCLLGLLSLSWLKISDFYIL